MKTLGDRVRQLRTEKGDTQIVLGRIAGVSKQAISKIERTGVMKSEAGTLNPIATHYGVNMAWLLSGVEPKYAEPAIPQGSHVLRLDPAMIAETVRALRKDEKSYGRVFTMETDADAALFMHWYAIREQLPDVKTLTNLIRLSSSPAAATTPQGAIPNGRSEGVPAFGTNERNATKRGPRKRG